MILSKQLFVGEAEPTKTKMNPILDNETGVLKPHGGLWTSTYKGEGYGSEWLQWSYNTGWYEQDPPMWLLTPKDANLLVIDTYKDLEKMMDQYSSPFVPDLSLIRKIHFGKIAEKYDGIHLTSKGQAQTRFSYPYNLHGWDVECTLWFNWCFENVERLGL